MQVDMSIDLQDPVIKPRAVYASERSTIVAAAKNSVASEQADVHESDLESFQGE